MNIFEQLIDELKEENLLEETVIESNGNHRSENKVSVPLETAEEKNETSFSADEDAPEIDEEISADTDETGFEFKPSMSEDKILGKEEAELFNDNNLKAEVPESAEFFFRRAKEEVASLQMVEHILSGAERDQMKVIPKTFDDLAVKTALHKFGKVALDTDSTQQSQAEFELMQETENWYSALSQRDKNISIGNLRRFCETTRPALSSQALLALARFYRNAPYSESVRAKFDLIITRLLTKETPGNRRDLVFSRDEIIKHLEGLYAEWSSISLYSPDKDDSTLLLTALKFENFISEATETEKFDDLIKNDFFNRLRMIKESSSENFFAPVVTTAAIECNVRVGNRYVELVRAEDVNPEILIKKYGVLREDAVSDITGKTLQLAQVLAQKEEIVEPEKQPRKTTDTAKSSIAEKKVKKIKPKAEAKKKSRFAVNKWLISAAAIVIFGNVALFFLVGNAASESQTSAVVADKVNLENSVLKEHLESARMSSGVFYGRVAPSWNGLSEENKELFLKKIMSAGNERGFSTVHLLDGENKPIAYANRDRFQINE